MHNEARQFSLLKVLIFIITIEIIGWLSSILAGDVREIYNGLILPNLSPPAYLFGIVWPILYTLIGISGYLIYKNRVSKTDQVLNYVLFILQLFLNFIWSIIFFAQSSYWLGFIIILVLDLVVFLCIIQFWKTSRTASLLLIPYFLWIIFASYLTFSVAMLN